MQIPGEKGAITDRAQNTTGPPAIEGSERSQTPDFVSLILELYYLFH